MAGGGARAFTHIGVVKAMRASGVPIDLIGGTSMGAIVAAGVAARWTDEELVSRFRRSFVDTNPLSDYTHARDLAVRRASRQPPAAHRVRRTDIEDLILPFFCVTANLTTSNADVHTVGRLWRWLRASGVDPRRPAALQPGGRSPCRRRRHRQFPGARHAPPGPRHHHRRRHRHRRRAGGRRRRHGAVVGVGVLPAPDVEARRDAADPLDRAHPAALGPGRQHRAGAARIVPPPTC